jgi:hypothetical protein
MEKPITELHDRIKLLEKRLAEVERGRLKDTRLSGITNSMVNGVFTKVHAMFESTDPKELKTALTHFIGRITVHGQDVTIEYTFKQPVTKKVPTNGDPGGI